MSGQLSVPEAQHYYILCNTLFTKSTKEVLHAARHNMVVLKIHGNSNIENLGVCLGKGKFARCRYFIVPGDSPALLGILDIELLGILMIMCELAKINRQAGNSTFRK